MTIGITQRVDVIPQYGERRDCLDQNWFSFFEKTGLNVIPIPNSLAGPISFAKANGIGGLILSGGNDICSVPNGTNTAPERDRTEKLLLVYAEEKKLPVIGVCRGFQFMNIFLNGGLADIEGHVGKRHEVIPALKNNFFETYNSVNSFHQFGIPIDRAGNNLEPILYSKDGYIEAARHKQLPWTGIMWHPEREKPFNNNDILLFQEHFTENI